MEASGQLVDAADSLCGDFAYGERAASGPPDHTQGPFPSGE